MAAAWAAGKWTRRDTDEPFFAFAFAFALSCPALPWPALRAPQRVPVSALAVRESLERSAACVRRHHAPSGSFIRVPPDFAPP